MLRKSLITIALSAAACSPAHPAPPASGGEDLGVVAFRDLSAPGIGPDAAAPDAAVVDAGAAPLYDTDGPETYQQLQLTATRNGSSIPLTVYLPSTAGLRPVVMLSSGLQQPGAAYAPYARRLASWGIIAILRDDPGVLAQSQSVADDIVFVIATWLPMQNGSSSAAFSGRIDLGRVGLAGHSRGGMVSLLAAAGGLQGKLKGFFGIDPVDNGGMAAKAIGGIAIPCVFLGETTDAMGSTACAPADQDYDVLYRAAPAPSLEITAVGADHTEFEDPASCAFCTLCAKGTADGATVLRYSTRYLTAFFARELLGDTRVGPTLSGAGLAADVSAGLVSAQSK